MIFLTYGELIESLANGFFDISFNVELPVLEDQLGFSMELLNNFLDPRTSVYEIRQNYKADPIGIYQHLLTHEAASNSVSTFIHHNSKLLARIGNEHVLSLDALGTSIEQLRDLAKITSVYLSRQDRNTYKYRVYPDGSDAQKRGGLTGHVEALEELKAAAMSQLDDDLGTSRRIAQENLDKIAKVLPKNGKAKIEIETGSKKLMNAMKFRLGATQGNTKQNNAVKVMKIEGRDNNGNPIILANLENSILNGGQFSQGVIPLAPSVGNKLVVHLESPKETSGIIVLDMTPLKIKYKGNGKIAEKEFVVPKPITTISIVDEDYDLSETAREFFEAIHEVKLEESEEWIKLRPRNSDNYESSLPEIILVGSQYALPGVFSVQTEKPITKFKYRASFKRKASIPLDVLMDLYAQRLNRETKKIVVPLASLSDAEATVALPTFPLEKPRAYLLNSGIVTKKIEDGLIIGQNSPSNTLYLPGSFVDVQEKSRLVVMKGIESLSWTDSATPSTSQFTVDENGALILSSSSQNGEDVCAYLKPERLDIVPNNASSPYYSFKLEHSPGFVDGNLRLFYKTYPDTETETFAIQDLKQAFENIYRIDLGHKGLSTVTLKALDSTLSDITSTIFASKKTYKSGIENTANGDYSIDEENGRIYFRLDTFQKLTLAASYSYSEEVEVTSDIVPHLTLRSTDELVTQKSFEFEPLTETIPSGTTSFTLGSSLSLWDDWKVVGNSIAINEYSSNPSVSNLHFVENIIVKKTSNNGTVSSFNLPLIPVDPAHEVTVSDNGSFITTKGAAGDGGWNLVNNKSIEVNDSGDVLDYIIVSYTFKKTEQVDIDKHFVFHPATREINFGEATTQDLIVKYDIQSYYATYFISTEVDTDMIVFDSDKRKEIKFRRNILADADASNNPDKASQKLLVVYPQIKQDAAREAAVDGNDPSSYLTVLPKHVDIEVGTT
jgi:hypothetical protein